MFVIIAKICRQEKLTLLFQTVEAPNVAYKALELKRTKGSKVWQLNEKSHVLIQDSSFVVRKEVKKDELKDL